MAGHSKWAQIKRKKAKEDAKRGKIFTKLAREITIAAREGGGDVNANARLRLAVQNAKAGNMPNDNIDRAVQRGTGEGGGAALVEMMYEGYAPGGVALLVEVMTDNTNRTVSEVRHAFNKGGGSLGEPGCVAWNFDKRGVISVSAEGMDEEELMLLAIDAGAEDVSNEGDEFEVVSLPEDFEAVRSALEQAGVAMHSAELSYVAKSLVPVSERDAHKCLNLIEALEDLDDVQAVYANVDVPEEVLAAMEG